MHIVADRHVVTLATALARMAAMLGVTTGWLTKERLVGADGPARRSALASGFLAALELARQGRAEFLQAPLAPLELRPVR